MLCYAMLRRLLDAQMNDMRVSWQISALSSLFPFSRPPLSVSSRLPSPSLILPFYLLSSPFAFAHPPVLSPLVLALFDNFGVMVNERCRAKPYTSLFRFTKPLMFLSSPGKLRGACAIGTPWPIFPISPTLLLTPAEEAPVQRIGSCLIHSFCSGFHLCL